MGQGCGVMNVSWFPLGFPREIMESDCSSRLSPSHPNLLRIYTCTDLFHGGDSGEPPSKGVIEGLIWALKAAPVTDLMSCLDPPRTPVRAY